MLTRSQSLIECLSRCVCQQLPRLRPVGLSHASCTRRLQRGECQLILAHVTMPLLWTSCHLQAAWSPRQSLLDQLASKERFLTHTTGLHSISKSRLHGPDTSVAWEGSRTYTQTSMRTYTFHCLRTRCRSPLTCTVPVMPLQGKVSGWDLMICKTSRDAKRSGQV